MSEHGHVQEAEEFLSNYPEIESIDLLISDLNGIARGKRVEHCAIKKIYQDGVNLPASIFSMNILGETVEPCGLGIDIGEPDMVCKPVANTLHVASWHQRPTAQVLLSMYHQNGEPFHADPRHILSNNCNKMSSLGLTPVVAVELEFYLFDKNRDNHGRPQAPISPKTHKRDVHTQVYSVDTISDYSDFLDDVNKACKEQQVPADTAVAECAPGQFEINLKHQADPLLACDNAILLKRIIKAIADKHDFDVSFMAKPYSDEAGSGMHVHVSLLDDAGVNIFADEDKAYSPQLEYAIAGLLEFLPASMPILCPNVNSYRRFQPQFYVATSLNWGFNNRTVALRLPSGSKAATRIEHRVAGADANPYLVMSVILASIHHGLTNKSKPLCPPSIGNAFDCNAESLPIKLPQALAILKQDSALSEYLGKKFIDIYLTAKEQELMQFDAHITELETLWYLNSV